MPITEPQPSSTNAMLQSLAISDAAFSAAMMSRSASAASATPKKHTSIREFIHSLLSKTIEENFKHIQAELGTARARATLTINESIYQPLVDNMSKELIDELNQLLSERKTHEDKAAKIIYSFIERYNPLLFDIINKVFKYLSGTRTYIKTEIARETTIALISTVRQDQQIINLTGVAKTLLEAQRELLVTHCHGLFDDKLRTSFAIMPQLTAEQKENYKLKEQEAMSLCYMAMIKTLSTHKVGELYRILLTDLLNEKRFITAFLTYARSQILQQMILDFFVTLALGIPDKYIRFSQMVIVGEIRKMTHAIALDTIEESDSEIEEQYERPSLS